MSNIKKRIEELELESSSNSEVFCELYSEIRSLKENYLTLKTAIVGLGRKLGVELILYKDDEINCTIRRLCGENRNWVKADDLVNE